MQRILSLEMSVEGDSLQRFGDISRQSELFLFLLTAAESLIGNKETASSKKIQLSKVKEPHNTDDKRKIEISHQNEMKVECNVALRMLKSRT